jgi:hypothetical protein
MEVFVTSLAMLRRLLVRVGPYIFLEIVLPGGTLVALLLYLYRHRKSSINLGSLLRSAIPSTALFARGGSSPA